MQYAKAKAKAMVKVSAKANPKANATAKAETKAWTITLKHRNCLQIFYANFAEIKFQGTSSLRAIMPRHLTAIPIFQAAQNNL